MTELLGQVTTIKHQNTLNLPCEYKKSRGLMTNEPRERREARENKYRGKPEGNKEECFYKEIKEDI